MKFSPYHYISKDFFLGPNIILEPYRLVSQTATLMALPESSVNL